MTDFIAGYIAGAFSCFAMVVTFGAYAACAVGKRADAEADAYEHITRIEP